MQLLFTAKKENPDLIIKLNTVVTNVNAAETLIHSERELSITHWKFLKMNLLDDGKRSNRDLEIEEGMFQCFLQNNTRTCGKNIPESSLAHSYIIADNRGSLINNTEEIYKTSAVCSVRIFGRRFPGIHSNEELYASRYGNVGEKKGLSCRKQDSKSN